MQAESPRQVYEKRLAERRERVEAFSAVDARLAGTRLFLVVAGAAMAWAALIRHGFSWVWLLVPVVAFLAVAVLHDTVIRRRRRAERAVRYYEHGLDRLAGRWAGRGKTGAAFLDPEHPYAADLDLFGGGSLYELLCAARTVSGERTLAGWLLAPAEPAEVRRRQQAVAELRPMLDMREELAVLGGEVGSRVDPDRLIAWGAERRVLEGWLPVLLAALLALANFVTLLAWWGPMLDPAGPPDVHPYGGSLPFWVSVALSGLLGLLYRGRVHRVLHGADRPLQELELLSSILAVLERQSFRSPLLVELRAALESAGRPPSRRIARLAHLTQADASRHNLLFRPFAYLMLLATQLAFAMERWRAASGPAIERWLRAVGQIEALSSLAGQAYEHPADPFPEIVEEGPLFDGRALGHPLLAEAVCVTNDLRLDGDLQLLLVSGSNMSGKSTLLRTVGVNTVLGLAGAPVRAGSLRLSPLAVGACMRVLDSLQEGLSHFYAEIRRLKRLVDRSAEPPPLLFLLDEILHGTHSHDRRVGAEALIRGLADAGAIGLVTTHDLALAEIADRLGDRAANVHFEDHLEEGEVRFDFRLRPGVVQKSNALDLMRSIGLDV
jgi:hypothetical protein